MRLFVAVWPPPVVVEAVRTAVDAAAAVVGPDRSGGDLRWTSPEQWHVTLRFLGEAERDGAERAFRSMAALPGDGAVRAELGPGTERFGGRVLHVPVAGLEGLAAATVAATRDVGRPPDDRPFAGHLTLARVRKRGGADLTSWCGIAVSGCWTVGELTLVASRTDRDGARYEVVDRLPLG